MDATKSPRILIARLSHIGDCVLTMPLACALRDHFPHAFIAWAVEGISGVLLEGHRAIDCRIDIPKGFLKSPGQIWGLRHRLRQHRFDIAIDPQSLTKSAAVSWLSGARQRIGFHPPQGREVSMWLNNHLIDPTREHLVDRQLELLAPLGICHSRARFDVPHNVAAERAMDRFLCEHGLVHGFATINPGAGWNSKLWPHERFARVAEYLGRTRALVSVVVWAGDCERHWAETIVARSGGHAIAAPQTSLHELAALLRRSDLMISADTGPLHLAAAVGTPCVSMFGPTRPSICGPYGKAHIALQKFYQAGSAKQRRRGDNRAMQAITVGEMCDACNRVLDRTAKRAA